MRMPRPTTFANPLDDPLRQQNPLVERRWLVWSTAMMLGAALLAVYASLALLFWQGQWQLIFHPSHVVDHTPASSGIPFEDVRFGATETGQPRLTGWWVPAAANQARSVAGSNRATVLYLHDVRGSLDDALPDVLALHTLGVDVFAFDPRGYGNSAWAKPSERHWDEDATAALSYVTSVRHAEMSHVIPTGRGLGATVAATLTLEHPEIRSVAMIDLRPPTLALLQAPAWTRILPVRLLARDHFDADTALHSSTAAKLFLMPADAALPARVTSALPPLTIVSSIQLGDNKTTAALENLFAETAAAHAVPPVLGPQHLKP
jgi:pimeloyl-ACP methyl ester carboxylesterase